MGQWWIREEGEEGEEEAFGAGCMRVLTGYPTRAAAFCLEQRRRLWLLPNKTTQQIIPRATNLYVNMWEQSQKHVKPRRSSAETENTQAHRHEETTNGCNEQGPNKERCPSQTPHQGKRHVIEPSHSLIGRDNSADTALTQVVLFGQALI